MMSENYLSRYAIKTDSVTESSYVITKDSTRISILTDYLIRIETQANKK